MKRWYVIQTKPKKEESVYKLFVNGGFEAFLPRIRTLRRVGRAKTGPLSDKIQPLFPSYLFIRLPFDRLEDFRIVRYTRGVNKIIGDEEGAVAIQDEVIEVIQERVGDKGYIDQGSFLQPKDQVLVKRGMLKDLVGILEKPIDDQGRVQVLFKIVHHQMRAKLHCSDLEKTE